MRQLIKKWSHQSYSNLSRCVSFFTLIWKIPKSSSSTALAVKVHTIRDEHLRKKKKLTPHRVKEMAMDRPWPRVKYAENFHHSTSTPVEPTEKTPHTYRGRPKNTWRRNVLTEMVKWFQLEMLARRGVVSGLSMYLTIKPTRNWSKAVLFNFWLLVYILLSL